jgi:hypothetical protein
MRITRTSIAAGLTIGVLAGGAGGALAATTSSRATIPTTSSTPTSSSTTWNRYGSGWGRGGRWQDRAGNGWGQWRHPAPGAGWGTDTTMTGSGW